MRLMASHVALAILGSLTGIVGAYSSAQLLLLAQLNDDCPGGQCCFICNSNINTPSCISIPMEGNEGLGTPDSFCTNASLAMGAGGIYYRTRGDCESSPQCNPVAMQTCTDGKDNDADFLVDTQDPDCQVPLGAENSHDSLVDLSLRFAGPAEAKRGSKIQYTITVENQGMSAAENVDVYGTIGASFTHIEKNDQSQSSFGFSSAAGRCSVTPNSFSCFGIDLNPGERFAHTFHMVVDEQQPACGSSTPTIFGSVFSPYIETDPSDNASEFRTRIACPACMDNHDNDGNGLWDFPHDPGCLSPMDDQEKPEDAPQKQNFSMSEGSGEFKPPFIPPHLQNEKPSEFAPPMPPNPFIVMPVEKQPEHIAREERRIRELETLLKERQLRNAVNMEALPSISAMQDSLGCFTKEGNWTTDRSLCDFSITGPPEPPMAIPPEQQTVDNPPFFAQVDENSIRRNLRAQFVGTKKYEKLMDVLHAAERKLERLAADSTLSPEQAQVVEESMRTVEEKIWHFRAGQYTVEEIDTAAAEMEHMAARIHEALAPERTQTDIYAVMSRVGQLLADTYAEIQVLFRERIYVDPAIISQYQQASAMFMDVQSRCYVSADACTDLRNVIEIAEPILDDLHALVAASGNPAIEKEIEQIFRH